MMEFPPPSAQAGVLHYIPKNLNAFEPSKPLSKSGRINTLLWIGGLGDTLLSVSYPLTLAQSLGAAWSLMIASLTSSGKSWGVESIARDAEDMAKIVSYIHNMRPGGKVLIMGHSTGCQDCMEYVVGAKASQRLPINGIILQAPVSDREALAKDLPAEYLHQINNLALQMCREGRAKDALPNHLTASLFGRTAISARRWVDIASPGPAHDGADDYFSSDLSDERLARTFGKLTPATPLLVLYSGDDESVAKSLDKAAVIQRWVQAVEKGGGSVDVADSGIIDGATHNLNCQQEKIIMDLVGRVNRFIERIDPQSAAEVGPNM